MKNILPLILIFACLTASAAEKPRIFVLTDIENEPDDAMSMVRLLTYANHMDIEGLAATTSVHQQRRVAPDRIRRIVEAYAKVRDNLEKHEQGFPTGEALLALITEGIPVYGMNGVGEGKDSPASEALIKAADKDDPRPLWVTAWGGPAVLAQSLWKVRKTRSAEELDKFVSKLRVYTISDQDNSGPWIRVRSSPICSMWRVRVSIQVVPTITQLGAASVATTFTLVARVRTLVSLRTSGWRPTCGEKGRWAKSIRTGNT